MNRIFLFIVLFVSSIFAQDFTGIRIYINPGHGGHDSDDRFIPETKFWESEGNLTKGLYLKSILDSLNATTKISRTTNTTDDDLPLSTIAADANNFDADYFQSIHSNATGITSKRNTTLVLYRGYTDEPVYPEAKIMANLVATQIYLAHRTTSKSIYGDWTFYPDWGTQGLGVLRPLTMPGTLSEGSFHDYIPESWRLKNSAYLKHEAWAFVKAYISYFNLTTLPYGEIAGIARDKDEIVDYFYLSGTLDKYKPTNLVKAVLMPNNIVYNGDSYNNGFFFFDRVQPGDYSLIIEAENYEKDTVQVSVNAGQTTFADQFLIAKPDYSVPVVLSYSPSQTEDVRLDENIVLNFNVKMNEVSTTQAFSIFPNITGTYTWENNYKRLIFNPTGYLKSGTNYKVGLNIFAKSYYNVSVDSLFSFSFKTRASLKFLSSYPKQGSGNISKTVKIILQFDAPIQENSLGGNIFFQDMQNNDIDLAINETDYANGKIIFEPLKPLSANSEYQIKLLSGISDTEGSNFGMDTTIIFTTEPNINTSGTIISDFEEIGNWWQPKQSGSTFGIDTTKTSFQIVKNRFVSGSNSGKLNYTFTSDSSGICRIYNANEFQINSGSQNNFGIWIFGDLSNNILEYWFRDSDSNNVEIEVDTINWTGWKFKEVNIGSIINPKFHSIVIVQSKLGENGGEIYFDDAQSDVITGLNENINSIPNKFVLYQNYPNPFNPATVIKYSLPVSRQEFQTVQLKVYDILGREVATLVNKKQKLGNFEVTFDASNLSSGVYYYQLKVGNFIQTKKMILLK